MFLWRVEVETTDETTDTTIGIGATIGEAEVDMMTATDAIDSIDVTTEGMVVGEDDQGRLHDEITTEEAHHDVPEDASNEQNLVSFVRT